MEKSKGGMGLGNRPKEPMCSSVPAPTAVEAVLTDGLMLLGGIAAGARASAKTEPWAEQVRRTARMLEVVTRLLEVTALVALPLLLAAANGALFLLGAAYLEGDDG